MVCHVLSNRVLEMGRYVKRDPDVTVSQEIIGTIVAATVMLGIWGLLVATIKGISKLTKLAENKIKSGGAPSRIRAILTVNSPLR